MRRILSGVLLCWAGGTFLAAQEVGTVPHADPPFFALTGATVSVGNGDVLNDATVVIRDGLIEAVGVGIPAPQGAWVIDATGMFVYPGLIDTLNNEAFKSDKPTPQQGGEERPGRGGPPAPASPEGPGYFAHVSAADNLESDQKLAAWREGGVLAVNAAPSEGIFRGKPAVVNLNGMDSDRMVVRADTGMNMSFQTLGFRTYPGSLLGVIAHIRQTLSDAAHYRVAWSEYEKSPRGLKRPETDRTLDALGPVVEGKMPMVFPAQTRREINRALDLCREAGARCLIAGGFQASEVADRLKAEKVPVLVSLNYPKKPKDQHPEAEEQLEAIRYRVNAPKTAAALNEAGLPFAFCSDGSGSRDFLPNLRMAVEKGLPAPAALRAATLSAAEILGVADELGSLEKGKIANLIVSDRDLFDEKAQIRHVFVDGVHYDYPAKKEDKKKSDGDAKSVDLSGEWAASVDSPGGRRTMTFSLKQEGAALQGSVTSEQGSTPIRDGSIDGDSFSFKIDVDFGAGPTEITFSGTAEGESLTGTATVGQFGGAAMEAKRIP